MRKQRKSKWQRVDSQRRRTEDIDYTSFDEYIDLHFEHRLPYSKGGKLDKDILKDRMQDYGFHIL